LLTGDGSSVSVGGEANSKRGREIKTKLLLERQVAYKSTSSFSYLEFSLVTGLQHLEMT